MTHSTSSAANQGKSRTAHKAEPLIETIPLPTYDGGCLGQIPVFPLQRDTQYLANRSFHKSWETTIKGTKHAFYCEGKYGPIPPNGFTQDVVVMACHFANQHGSPAFVPSSFYQFAKVKGVSPCRSQKNSVIRVFRSTKMTLATNAIYDPQADEWETVEIQSIISSFAYIDADGRYRERYLTKQSEDGETVRVKSEEQVRKLKRFSIDPEYYERFVGGGRVHYDLNAYFHMANPTRKRAYLNLCSAVQLFGEQELLFKTYLKLLGKDSTYVDERSEHELQQEVWSDLEAVNQVGVGQIRLEPSAQGLTTILGPQKKVIAFAPDLKCFSPLEQRTIRELCQAGLYINIAKTFVVRFSQALRRDLLSYTQFVIREETKRAKARLANKTARVTDLRRHVGSNLSKAFCLDPDSVDEGKRLGDHWHYGAWRDYQSKRKRGQYPVPAEVAKATQLIGKRVGTITEQTIGVAPAMRPFDLIHFRREYEVVYFRIVKAVHEKFPIRFEEGLSHEAKMQHIAQVEQQRAEAIEKYCYHYPPAS